MKEAVPGPISGCEDRLGEGDSFGGGCWCGPSTARVRAAVGPSQQSAQEGCSRQRD